MAQNVYTCVYNIIQSCTGWRDFSFFRKCRLIFHGLLLTSMRGSPSLGYEHKHCWHCITVKPITFRLLQWSILQIKESGSTAIYLSARLKRLQSKGQQNATWSTLKWGDRRLKMLKGSGHQAGGWVHLCGLTGLTGLTWKNFHTILYRVYTTYTIATKEKLQALKPGPEISR